MRCTVEERVQLAKGMVAMCVRNNNVLEDYHAQQVPITDERMKEFMIDCVDNMFLMLNGLLSENEEVVEGTKEMLKFMAQTTTYEWNGPKTPAWAKACSRMLKGFK